MRLSARRALINLALFGGILCFILYVNLSPSWTSSRKTFGWTTVRYKSPDDKLDPQRGICPGLKEDSKPALVVSHVEANGDLTWLDALKGQYHFCVYKVDQPIDERSQLLQVPANRAHEAMAYLTFIIDNYPSIPAAGAVFVHGSRFSWHNDEPAYDNAALLAALNTSAALEPTGYHNLRCDWSASTCALDYGASQNSLETKLNAKLQPWDMRAASDAGLVSALTVLFDENSEDEENFTKLGRDDAIRSQCCAQFIVSRERVWQHSRDEYIALRQWLLDGSAPADDRISGRIVSYLWHILFLRKEALNAEGDGINLQRLNELACPSAAECYCRLYGQCDLKGCTAGSCPGQYVIPQDYTLPDDWAATHS